MGGFDAWVGNFASLHERARAGKLSPAEQQQYLLARDELGRGLVKAQNLMLRPGQKPRQAVRVAVALPLQIQLPHGAVKALTQDLSAGGFAAIMPALMVIGLRARFVLTLGREAGAVEGEMEVVGSQIMGTSCRMSAAFEGLPAKDVERIEFFVFDHVLKRLQASGM